MPVTTMKVAFGTRLRKALVVALLAVCVAVWSAPLAADPPPWAPAWGYRFKGKAKGKGKNKFKHVGVAPFGINLGRCNRDVLGGVLGAAAGGFLGSKVGDGRGQLAAVAGGTLLGLLIGGSIGRMMDEVDQNCVGQALEHGEDGQKITWNNTATNTQYQVVPTKTTKQADGRYCREYTTTATIGGKKQQLYGTACRQPDGAWEFQR